MLTRPYSEPSRHWKTVAGQTSNEIVNRRRSAEEPLPMGQNIPVQQDLGLGTDGVDAGAIDALRAEVRRWRNEGWPSTSNATRELLEYWSREPSMVSFDLNEFAKYRTIRILTYSPSLQMLHTLLKRCGAAKMECVLGHAEPVHDLAGVVAVQTATTEEVHAEGGAYGYQDRTQRWNLDHKSAGTHRRRERTRLRGGDETVRSTQTTAPSSWTSRVLPTSAVRACGSSC